MTENEELYIIQCRHWTPEKRQNLLNILRGHGIKAFENEWYLTIEIWSD